MYARSKLFEIIRVLTINEGNSAERLAEVGHKILLLNKDEIPEKFKSKFIELQKLITVNYSKNYQPGFQPSRIYGLRKKKASEYIEFLFELNHVINFNF
jgi:hypothetical protein